MVSKGESYMEFHRQNLCFVLTHTMNYSVAFSKSDMWLQMGISYGIFQNIFHPALLTI